MPITTELKRQNFNVTPEQEAELLRLQTELDAPSMKEAIFKAVRLTLLPRREIKNGRRINLKDRDGNVSEVILPELEARWFRCLDLPCGAASLLETATVR